MIKAIIFDFFGVIIGDGFDNTYKNAGGNPLKDRKFIVEQLYLNNSGAITKDEFRQNIANRLGISPEEFSETIKSSEPINNKLLDYIRNELHPKYKTAILSNASAGAIERRIDSRIIKDCFDTVVVSAEVGFLKPEKEIYKLTAKRVGVESSECVFVDDKEGYVIVAERLGMKAILYRNFEQCKNELGKLLAEN